MNENVMSDTELRDVLPEILAEMANQQTPTLAEAPTEAVAQTPAEAPAEVPLEAEAPVETPIPEAVTEAPPVVAETDPNRLIQTEQAIRAATALEAAKNEIEQLKAQLAEAQRLQTEMSHRNAETVDEVLTAPPDLDFSKFEYMTDEERANAQRDYTDKLTNFVLGEVKKQFGDQIKPVVDGYRKAENEARDAAILNAMKGMELPGFAESQEEIRRFSQLPELASLPADKRYTLSFLLAKGKEAVNTKPMGAEDIYKMASANPEVMRRIAAEQAKALEKKAELPVFSASSGSASAPVDVPKRPETLDEAREQAFKALSLFK